MTRLVDTLADMRGAERPEYTAPERRPAHRPRRMERERPLLPAMPKRALTRTPAGRRREDGPHSAPFAEEDERDSLTAVMTDVRYTLEHEQDPPTKRGLARGLHLFSRAGSDIQRRDALVRLAAWSIASAVHMDERVVGRRGDRD